MGAKRKGKEKARDDDDYDPGADDEHEETRKPAKPPKGTKKPITSAPTSTDVNATVPTPAPPTASTSAKPKGGKANAWGLTPEINRADLKRWILDIEELYALVDENGVLSTVDVWSYIGTHGLTKDCVPFEFLVREIYSSSDAR